MLISAAWFSLSLVPTRGRCHSAHSHVTDPDDADARSVPAMSLARSARLVRRGQGGRRPDGGCQVGLIKLGPQSPVSPGPEELIASRVTDASGSYNFPSVENVSFSGALVSVSKADYFTDTKYILMSQDRQLDFDLERAVDISVGQVILSQIGEARCASFGYGGMGGAVCRRFALPLHASGTLEVTVSSSPAAPFDITVLRPDGTIGVNVSSSFRH